MDRGAWWATVHGVAKELDTAERLTNNNNLYREHRRRKETGVSQLGSPLKQTLRQGLKGMNFGGE